jgi:hypothetical protein
MLEPGADVQVAPFRANFVLSGPPPVEAERRYKRGPCVG